MNRHLKRYYTICLVPLTYASFAILSCQPHVDEDELAKANDNRKQIETVLNYFQQHGSDLEYQSTVFLVNNMPYHVSMRGHLVEHYDEAFAEMAERPIGQRNEFYKHVNNTLGKKGIAYDYDIHNIHSDLLKHSISQACSAWDKVPWRNKYPLDIFLNYVLPYKAAEEPASEWRIAIKDIYPRLGKNEVRSRRGPMMEFEDGSYNCQSCDAVGASGKVVQLTQAGDSVSLSFESERATRKSLLLRYSCPELHAQLKISANGRQPQTVELVPSNDAHTFIHSQNVIDIDIVKGKNTIVLEYCQKSIALDYLHLKTIESLPADSEEGFAFGSSLINEKFGKVLSFSQPKDANSSSLVFLADCDEENTWQQLDICLRGYGSYTVSPISGYRDSLCLEAQYGNCNVGTRGTQYRFIGAVHQLWTFIPAGKGKYRIMGRDSGLYLEAKEENGELCLFLNPFAVHQDAQIWKIKECRKARSVLYSKAVREAMKVYDYMYLWKWCPCNVIVPPTSATLLRSRTGNCYEEACFVVNLCRYLGIPAAIDFTPHWGNRSQAHEWSVLIDENRKGVPFYMNKIPGDTTNSFNGYKKPKVLRNCFAIDRHYQASIQRCKLPEPWLMFPCYEDVTSEYGAVTDVERRVPDSLAQQGIAYICVFDNRRWVPVFWGDIENGKVLFRNMARDIMYIAAIVDQEGKIQPFGCPFSIDNFGLVNDVEIDTCHTQSMRLLRKFPFLGKQDPFNTRMDRGRFQAADNPDFNPAVDLYYFTGITDGNWYEVDVKEKKAYQYLRYIGPGNSYCNINEIQFLGQDGTPLAGSIIGTQGKAGYEKEKVFDGNILTGFDGISPDGHWIGVKLNRPSTVDKIRFIGRNDGNTIEVGDKYGLYYWDYRYWQLIDTRIAEENQLVYHSVPAHGLYVLKDRTKGWEERIFTYENGKQIWW